MITLDEAIKHCEEVAEKNEKQAKECHDNQVRKCEVIPFAEMDYTRENECLECASEHRQLAEWLRELKTHREIHDVLLQLLVDFDLDMCCEDLMDNEEEQKICEENCNNKTKGCWVRWAKLKAREVNADDCSKHS